MADGSSFTLETLFEGLDGQYYGNAAEMEEAVIGVVNTNILELPTQFSYKDAVAAALQHGWFRTNPDGTPGVRIDLGKVEPDQ